MNAAQHSPFDKSPHTQQHPRKQNGEMAEPGPQDASVGDVVPQTSQEILMQEYWDKRQQVQEMLSEVNDKLKPFERARQKLNAFKTGLLAQMTQTLGFGGICMDKDLLKKLLTKGGPAKAFSAAGIRDDAACKDQVLERFALWKAFEEVTDVDDEILIYIRSITAKLERYQATLKATAMDKELCQVASMSVVQHAIDKIDVLRDKIVNAVDAAGFALIALQDSIENPIFGLQQEISSLKTRLSKCDMAGEPKELSGRLMNKLLALYPYPKKDAAGFDRAALEIISIAAYPYDTAHLAALERLQAAWWAWSNSDLSLRK